MRTRAQLALPPDVSLGLLLTEERPSTAGRSAALLAMLSGRRLLTHLGALAVMALGVAGVTALVLAMNRLAPPPQAPPPGKQVSFSLAPQPPPQRSRRVRPRPQPKRRTSAKSAPRPSLASSLSGPSFGLPGGPLEAQGEAASALLGTPAQTVMTEDAVDQPPRPQLQTAPAYPAQARARGVTGQVVLNLLISSSGAVEAVRVLEASPLGVFEESARAAVRRWTFQPATYKEQPVRVWAKQVVRFDLS